MLQAPRILVAEDHGTVRIGIKHMLQDALPSAQVVMTDNFNRALQILSSEPIDLVILDLNIPGGGAPSMIRKIKTIRQEIRVLIFSGYDEQIYALPCLQAGGDGYLSKNAPDEEFAVAVKSILNDRKYLSTEMQQQTINKIVGAPGKVMGNPALSLSPREAEVMQLLLKGMGTAEIAASVHLQLSTISTYKMKIFEKMGVKNIIELVEKLKQYEE